MKQPAFQAVPGTSLIPSLIGSLFPKLVPKLVPKLFPNLIPKLIPLLVLVLVSILVPGPAGTGRARAAQQALVISADSQFAYAESLFEEKDYSTAEVEFKRFIHFFPADPRGIQAAFKTGMALYHQEKFHDAARLFNDVILDDPDISFPVTHQAFFMQSRAFKHMGNTGYARIVLENFLKLAEDPDTRERIFLELAILHMDVSKKPGTDELDAALACLENISPDSALSAQKDERIQRIREIRALSPKNPVLAGMLGIIPGGGFLYTGRLQDAAAAFVINTGLGLAAYKAFDQDNPALGSVIVLAGSGFYLGNIYGGISAAHKHNHAQKIQILDREFSLGTGFNWEDNSVFFSFRQGF
jgi:tetratricopeptide (TPR) repeat protein